MSHPNTLTLHQLRYGELSAERAREVRQHIEDCPRCSAMLSSQQAARHEFELLPVPASIRKASAPSPWWRRLLDGVPALPAGAALVAAAALALVVVQPQLGGEDGRAPDTLPPEEIRTKGTGEVEILVEGRGILQAGQTLSEGERVQLQVPPGPHRHAWASDGRELMLPFPLEAGSATLAPFGLRLDSSDGDEVIYLVLSIERLDEGQARSALAGDPPNDSVVKTVTLPRGP